MNRLFVTTTLLWTLSAPALAQSPENPATTPSTTTPAVSFGILSFLQYSAELHEEAQPESGKESNLRI